MAVWVPTLASVLIVSAISLLGALTLTTRAARRHIIILALVAFAAGTLLGDSFIHLLPEAVEARGGEFTLGLSALILVGFLVFYFLEAALRWGHAHGEEAHPHMPPMAPVIPKAGGSKIAPFAWTNLAGDGLHNFVDGMLIAASYLADTKLGIATTVAVAAHEIPQELGDFAILLKAGMRPAKALVYNLASALLAVVGAIFILLISGETDVIEIGAVPFIAGGFLYIAAADLVPELHHHAEGRYIPVIVIGMLAGLAAMGGLVYLE